MLPKRIILKCVLLLAILSKVSTFMVLKINNLSEDELVSSVLNVVDKDNVRDARNNIFNNIAFRGKKLFNYLGPRRSGPRKYSNKRLVKRVVPHGYKVNGVEIDDKFQTLYKPLVRIHKKNPVVGADNDGKGADKYELMIVLNDDQFKDVTTLLPDEMLLKPFAIDNMDIQYFPNDKDVEDYIGIRGNGDLDTDYKLLDQKANLNADKLNDEGGLGPQRTIPSRIPMKFKKAYRTKMLNQASLVQKHRKREDDLDDVHNAKAITNMQWFGPVGHLVAKQLQSKERREKQAEANTDKSKSVDSKTDVKRSVDINSNLYWVKRMLETQKNTRERPIHKPNEMDAMELDSARSNTATIHQNTDKYYELIKKLIKTKQHAQNPSESHKKAKHFKDTPSNEINYKQDHLKTEIDKERHLRMHAVNEKSGEEGVLLPTFSWDQTEVTTEPPRSVVPQYPFYNYWTYEKIIHQDNCKGSLIQLGQLCIRDE